MKKLKFTKKSAIALYAMLAVVLSGCGFSPDSCEIAVREKYDGKSIWVKSMGSFQTIVLTKDSTLLHIQSRSMTYPYISSTDTIGVFGKHYR